MYLEMERSETGPNLDMLGSGAFSPSLGPSLSHLQKISSWSRKVATNSSWVDCVFSATPADSILFFQKSQHWGVGKCYGLNYVFSKIHMLKSQPLVPRDMTVFAGGDFTEVTEL